MRGYVEALDDVEFVASRLEDAFDKTWWTKVTGRAADPPRIQLANEG